MAHAAISDTDEGMGPLHEASPGEVRSAFRAGHLAGPMNVPMRPLAAADVIRAFHGAPVHFGKPELIGSADIARPEFAIPHCPGPMPVTDFRNSRPAALQGQPIRMTGALPASSKQGEQG